MGGIQRLWNLSTPGAKSSAYQEDLSATPLHTKQMPCALVRARTCVPPVAASDVFLPRGWFHISLSQQLTEINTNRSSTSHRKSFGQTCPQDEIKQKSFLERLQSKPCHLCFDISGGHVLAHIPDQSANHCQRDALWWVTDEWCRARATSEKGDYDTKTQKGTPATPSIPTLRI